MFFVCSYIASGAADDAIRIFAQDPASLNAMAPSYQLLHSQIHAHDSDVNCVAWNPKLTDTLASAGDDFVVKVWQWNPDSPVPLNSNPMAAASSSAAAESLLSAPLSVSTSSQSQAAASSTVS